MGYFLRVVCIIFVFTCLSSGDEFQDFVDQIEFWAFAISDHKKLINIVEKQCHTAFNKDELRAILDMKLPSMKDCHEISGEDWLIYGKMTFVKILLLATQGEMLKAETLRIQFDIRSLLIRTPVVFPFKWIVLMPFLNVPDEEWIPIQEEEERQYEEEVRSLYREYIKDRAMPLQTS